MFETNRRAYFLEGEQIGLKKGRWEEKQELARHMMADGVPLDKISQYTGLSRGEIEAL